MDDSRKNTSTKSSYIDIGHMAEKVSSLTGCRKRIDDFLKKKSTALYISNIEKETGEKAVVRIVGKLTKNGRQKDKWYFERRLFVLFSMYLDANFGYDIINCLSKGDTNFESIGCAIKKRENKACYTYIVVDTTGLCKIGKSTNIDRRFSELTLYNSSLRRLLVIKGDVEANIHKMFFGRKFMKEWFKISNKDIDRICESFDLIEDNRDKYLHLIP